MGVNFMNFSSRISSMQFKSCAWVCISPYIYDCNVVVSIKAKFRAYEFACIFA